MTKTTSPTRPDEPDATTRDLVARNAALSWIDALYAVRGLTEGEGVKLAGDVSALHSHRMMFNDAPAGEVVSEANRFYCGGFGVTVRLDVQSYGFVETFCRAMAQARDVGSDYAALIESRGLVQAQAKGNG